MRLLELLQKEYISSPYHWKEMWIDASKRDSDWDWIPIDKVRIRKIKIDTKYLPNEVDENEVFYVINNFEEEVWQPVPINEDYCLLDGQHRLKVAFHTGMKYIDAIMEKRKNPVVSKKMKEEKREKELFKRNAIKELLQMRRRDYYKHFSVKVSGL